MNKKVLLVILDGWGIAKPDKFNAIDNAKTPNFDYFMQTYPNMLLKADGENVGLPKGQMGTSEVNHLAIGTGRIVWQDLPKINKSIEEGTYFTNPELVKLVEHVKTNNSKLHLAMILSDGGVHSHIDHLFATLKFLKDNKFEQKTYIHVFTDGRDTPPLSAIKYLEALEAKINEIGIGEIATLQGRFYLDRDRDWEKTDIGFQLLRSHKGKKMNNWKEALDASYKKFDNDQYHEQYYFIDESKLSDNDGILFLNFRTDRIYQIIKRTYDEKIPGLAINAFCKPSKEFEYTPIFDREKLNNPLAEVLSKNSKKQYHITETEKYPHLTYFFDAEREQPYDGEEWKLYESNRYVKPNYNFEPSMQAFATTKSIIEQLEANDQDFIVVNYANTDMVGHTGNYEAAVIAAESVDYCMGKLYEVVKNKLGEWVMMVTADHGNSDEMWDYINNQPHTQHTLNPVPFIVITEPKIGLKNTTHEDQLLQNIAPTVLEFMGIPKAEEMKGYSLVSL